MNLDQLVLIFFMQSCLFFAAMPATAGHDQEIKKRHPYVVLETDTIDIGVVKTGSQVRPSVKLVNAGAHDLLIAKVRSSCGLMIPTWPVDPVSQGGEAVIQLRYDTSRPGPFVRHVMIHTNAWQKTLIITIMGEVSP